MHRKIRKGGKRFVAKVELKQPIVDEIRSSIDGAQSVVVVKYLGIDVAKDTALRKAFREADVNYKVYKNTMVRRAIEGTEFASLADVLEGPNAFAISKTDATAPARIISKFAKDVPALEIKAGIVERDPKEKGERALLNLGHTIGHAIEKLKNFTINHGMCVGIGLAAAAAISAGKVSGSIWRNRNADGSVSNLKKV